MEMHSFEYNIFPGVLNVISNLRLLSVSASERSAYKLWPLFTAYLLIVPVFRPIRMLAKSNYLLR
jgi:hypothetical protein